MERQSYGSLFKGRLKAIKVESFSASQALSDRRREKESSKNTFKDHGIQKSFFYCAKSWRIFDEGFSSGVENRKLIWKRISECNFNFITQYKVNFKLCCVKRIISKIQNFSRKTFTANNHDLKNIRNGHKKTTRQKIVT